MSINLENVVLASPEQMEFIIQGMRNPMNSWEKSDTCFSDESCVNCYYSQRNLCDKDSFLEKDEKLGSNDHSLMQRLSNAGTEHRKYMRMMPVYVRITAPLYWWKEFDTYKVGTVANSCSTMHKIAEKEFEWGDFSTEHLFSKGAATRRDDNKRFEDESCAELGFDHPGALLGVIKSLNFAREDYLNHKNKEDWWQLIQLLPSSYNQTRNVMLNYEVLANIYRQRKNHKLDEWREVCKWIETLPYSELITGLSIGSDQSIEEKRFTQPFPWNKDDVYCDNCEHFHDCLNKGGLADVTTSDDIVKNGFGRQHYVNKPGYDCPKEVQSRLAEDDPMNFSIGKTVHDLMAKELTEDVKKQILEEKVDNTRGTGLWQPGDED